MQLQTFVEYMEENPEFARGTPVFGGSKLSTEEQWKKVVLKLNTLGPPMRSIVEWKKVSVLFYVCIFLFRRHQLFTDLG